MVYFWAAIALLGIASIPILIGLLCWEIGFANWRKPSRGEMREFDRVMRHFEAMGNVGLSAEAWIAETHRGIER